MIGRIFCAAAILMALVQVTHAEDLDVYTGTGSKPNVLLVFDNSDYMFNCIGWNNSNDSNCGNYVKLKVARDVLLDVVASSTAQNFRLGLMSFAKDSKGAGGKIHLPCGASVAELSAKLNWIAGPDNSPIDKSLLYAGGTWTPLAETLAEAGLYFGGKPSAFVGAWPAAAQYRSPETATVDGIANVAWYANSRYVSPINSSCQQNYVIFLTTGEPKDYVTIDRNPVIIANLPGLRNGLAPLQYLLGNTANDGELFEDVAYYLYQNDFSTTHAGKQNIHTMIIGFDLFDSVTETVTKEGTKKKPQEADKLMKITARNGNGGEGNHYYRVETTQKNDPAVDYDRLRREFAKAFDDIFGSITSEVDSAYVPPTIPRKPDSQTEAGDRVYLEFFRPQKNGRWIGNLKAYKLTDNQLYDANDLPATYRTTDPDYMPGLEGYIRDTARSLWGWLPSGAQDGVLVDTGGAGKLLAGRTDRTVYAYLGANTDLKNAAGAQSNLFTTTNTNPALTPALLGVTTTAERDTVITETRNGVTITPTGTTTPIKWPLGDIVHSQPAVGNFEATYQNGIIDSGEALKQYLFVGANDGMLHVFNTANGREEWAFVPPGQLANLKKRTTLYAGSEHNYFVDGSPALRPVEKADGTTMQMLMFGERRGGKRYYALDVTNPDQPVFKYQLTDTLLTGLDWDGTGGPDGAAATLGQSWAKPQFKKVRSGNQEKEVFLLAGGYDSNQDATTPVATDTVGRAIYAVAAETGGVFGLNLNAGNWNAMTNAILEVTGFDKGGYGYIDRIYAGDLGGKILAARYNKCTNADCNDDSWTKTVLFDLPDTLTVAGTTIALGQKFMTQPEVALEPGKECIFIGTGDREHPLVQNHVNAIYAVCNTWAVSQPQPLAITHLVDVTDNAIQQGSDADKAAVTAALQSGYGWYLRLDNPGEKVISAPKLLNGKLYFTTFAQERPAVNVDPCSTPDLGISRLYAVDYLNGAAVFNFNADGQWSKEDRSIIIGSSMTGSPVLTTTGDTTSLFYGSDGKFQGMPVETRPNIERYFWRQLK